MIEVENKLYIKVGDLVEYYYNNDDKYEVELFGLLNGTILKIDEDKSTINILNNSGLIHEINIKDVSWNYSCFNNVDYWL